MSDKQPKLETLIPYFVICVILFTGGLTISILSFLIWGGRDAWGWVVSAFGVNTIIMIVGVMNAFGALD